MSFSVNTYKVIMNMHEIDLAVGFYWFLLDLLVSIGPIGFYWSHWFSIGHIIILVLLVILVSIGLIGFYWSYWFLLVLLVSISIGFYGCYWFLLVSDGLNGLYWIQFYGSNRNQ